MIRSLYVCRGRGTDPYENLALEEALLSRVGEGELILYLWQNERTVVIGKNQNPWKECRTALLAEEGGHLARRLSGGGAVFHDLGNLNFTFLMPEAEYALSRQLSVIELACRSLGVPVQRSGRNDLLADGRKFSGNAFYHHLGRAYHHGTLMVDVDLDRVQRYLSPSKAKLAAKGVDSVRSRVVNLKEFVPDLTVQRLADALVDALLDVYAVGGAAPEAPPCSACSCRSGEHCSPQLPRPPEAAAEAVPLRGRRPGAPTGANEALPLTRISPDEFELSALRAEYASDAWLYGQKLPFTVSVEDRFPWGGVELQLQVEHGVIRAVRVYTDAMDETLSAVLEQTLIGCAFRYETLSAALSQTQLSTESRNDLLSLLRKAL